MTFFSFLSVARYGIFVPHIKPKTKTMNKVNVWCTMALVMITFGFSACSDSEDENVAVDPGIIGEWKVASGQLLYEEQDPAAFIKTTAESIGMSEKEIEEANKIAISEHEGIDEVGGTYLFNADKTYSLSYPGDDETYGKTWLADENTLTLFYSDDENGANYEVRNITNSRATLAYVQQLTEENAQEFFGIKPEGGMSYTILLHLER